MKWFILFPVFWCQLAAAADPVRASWIMSPSPGVSRFSPEVQSVRIGEKSAIVESAGVSLKYFGPLQLSPLANDNLREFRFEIPLQPQPETGRHARVPVDVIGTFLNGLPIYNHFEALSWNGADLWHYDSVALNDDGTVTASGHARPELTNPAPAGLLEQLIQAGSRHSPLIGFALDGYPVYGPWAYANPDGTGGLRRVRSSYKLRAIEHRRTWPDGTVLTPEQYGPDAGEGNPPGTFAEDYEYVKGAGDLDEFNGRFTKTPEYPNGTYAYFLTTDDEGKLAFPYLIGPRFYGKTLPPAEKPWFAVSTAPSKRMELSASDAQIRAGYPVCFRLEARDAAGKPIRHWEQVHEQPIHFLIASADLAEFAHIHPMLATDDSFEVEYTFAHGGRYRLWADYSLPGEAPEIDEFDVMVDGAARPREKLTASALTQTAGSLTVKLAPAKQLRAGEDIPITLNLTGSTANLEPYLGAWAHVIVIGENFRSFAHAHPVEPAATFSLAHTHAVAGPVPDAIHIVTNFPAPGLYKMWAQFQQAGQVLAVPFVLQVAPAEVVHRAPVSIPANAIRVRVTQHGFAPAYISIAANKPSTLVFTRDLSPSCASEIVFPSLGIRKALPPGATVVIPLPVQPAGEVSFGCGMGMFRGMIVAAAVR